MEILGVGASEFVFILILALIILGPKDMQKAGKTIGKWLRSIITSDSWKVFQQTSRELRTLPNRLMRDANEDLKDVGKELKDTANLIDGKLQKPVSLMGHNLRLWSFPPLRIKSSRPSHQKPKPAKAILK